MILEPAARAFSRAASAMALTNKTASKVSCGVVSALLVWQRWEKTAHKKVDFFGLVKHAVRVAPHQAARCSALHRSLHLTVGKNRASGLCFFNSQLYFEVNYLGIYLE
jgi:hypothetical protein